MPNLIRVKQLEQSELTGLMQNVIESHQYSLTYASTGTNISNVGEINISGASINLTKAPISSDSTGAFLQLFSNNIIYNTGNETISGVKTFANSGIFSLSGARPLGLPNNPLAIVGSGNTYIQVNIQNRATGRFASADLVITANNGTDTSNFINLGINNSGYSDPAFTNGTGFDGYLFIDGGNLDIGTRTPGKAIEFHAGGTVAGSTIATITSSGLNIVSGNLKVDSGTGIFNALDLNSIDNLNLSGVDITITSGLVVLTNPVSAPNLVYNTGNQTISGVKTFLNSGVFSLSGASALNVPNNPLSIVGSGNTYLQLNIQNRATGLFASSDLVITADNGTDSSNFINLGINNNGYNDPSFTNGTGLDGYLFIDGGNLDIGTRTAGRAIEFHAGGTTLGSTIARISQSGLSLISGNFTYPVFSNATGFVFTPDASASTFFDYTLSGNSTLDQPINMNNGQSITIFLTQDSTGNRSMNFNTGYLFSNGITPTLNFLPSGTDILQVIRVRNKLYSTFASNY